MPFNNFAEQAALESVAASEGEATAKRHFTDSLVDNSLENRVAR
jgi:hypothetical protein